MLYCQADITDIKGILHRGSILYFLFIYLYILLFLASAFFPPLYSYHSSIPAKRGCFYIFVFSLISPTPVLPFVYHSEGPYPCCLFTVLIPIIYPQTISTIHQSTKLEKEQATYLLIISPTPCWPVSTKEDHSASA